LLYSFGILNEGSPALFITATTVPRFLISLNVFKTKSSSEISPQNYL